MTSPTVETPGTPAPRRPPLRQQIANRAWQLIQEAAADTMAAVRRAPGATLAQGLTVLRKLALLDPERVLSLLRGMRKLAPGSAFLAQGEAMMTARAKGWDAAAPLFLAARARKTPGAAAALLRQRPAPAIWPALPAAGRPVFLSPAAAGEIVIYTAAFGAAPGPAPRFHDLPAPRFLCLTDRADRAIPGWETVVVTPGGDDFAPGLAGEPARAAAWARILPHRALAAAAPAASASLYLAPDRDLVGNIDTLMLRWLLPHDLVLWRSDAGIDWQDLAEQRLIAADTGSGPVAEAAAAARSSPRPGTAPRGASRATGAPATPA